MNEGWISTEVKLPKDGQRVEYYLWSPKDSGVAMYANFTFYFDESYASDGRYPAVRHKTLGCHHGYWRPLGAEKLATEALEARNKELTETVRDLNSIIDEMGEEIETLRSAIDRHQLSSSTVSTRSTWFMKLSN